MSLPRPVQAVCFDMDGLLVDSEGVYREVMIAVAAEMGSVLTPSTFMMMIGTTREVSIELMLQTCGRDFDILKFDHEVERRVAAAGIPLKAGVRELMDVLDAAGLPYALVTNNHRAAIDQYAAPHGVIERFAALVFRGEAARGKPHPDPYLLAAERLRVEPAACLALEDSHNGIRAAHAAGMMAVMVPDMLEATEEMHGLCAFIAGSLHDITDLLTPAAGARRP